MNDYLKYSRHFKLPGFTIESQKVLFRKKVIIVGCGGLGHPVLTYLIGAGVRNIKIYDSDKVSLSNLNRQFLFNENDVGHSKVKTVYKKVSEGYKENNIMIYDEKVIPSNYQLLLRGSDVVIDCTDGLATKYFLNDACVDLAIPLIHGAVSGFQGQVLKVFPTKGCLRCIFGPLPSRDQIPTCEQVGILGASCGVVGSIMALEAIKFLIEGNMSDLEDFISIDLYKNNYRKFKIYRNLKCDSCGTQKTITPDDPTEYVVEEKRC